ncbi:hypothetical protein D3C81_2093360 [compost metagenome]
MLNPHVISQKLENRQSKLNDFALSWRRNRQPAPATGRPLTAVGYAAAPRHLRFKGKQAGRNYEAAHVRRELGLIDPLTIGQPLATSNPMIKADFIMVKLTPRVACQ